MDEDEQENALDDNHDDYAHQTVESQAARPKMMGPVGAVVQSAQDAHGGKRFYQPHNLSTKQPQIFEKFASQNSGQTYDTASFYHKGGNNL